MANKFMDQLELLRTEVKKSANSDKAKLYAGYFKTAEGEYGYGDIFLGLTVPQSRLIVRKYKDLPLVDVLKLLQSKYHEERLIALLLLVHKFDKADQKNKKEIFDIYLANTKYINNWDLVDLSAPRIVGESLLECIQNNNGTSDNNILEKLACSSNLWERRIAIVSTYQYIISGIYEQTFKVAEILLHDKEDLIQKGVGWMLREVGKRCSQEVEEKFLKKHYRTMPRTMLRYAIERFPEEKRRAYLNK